MSCNSPEHIESIVAKEIRKANVNRILATVSGGPDSVALLSSLLSIRGLHVVAAHCNFHLRGEESMRDQREVEKLCTSLGVDLLVKNFDVEKYTLLNKGVSVEMACRELRYKWFHEVVKSFSLERIATGHNADDNIETLFLNLLRGSGTAGLKSILPDNGVVIRPLLSISRNEILEYLSKKNLSFITDSSNLSSDYRRNFLRNEILPLLRTRWHGADKALTRTILHIREENKVVEQAVSNLLPIDGTPLYTKTVLDFASPELLVRRFIEPLQPYTTTTGEILDAIRAKKSDVRKWFLPKGRVELRGTHLFVIKSLE